MLPRWGVVWQTKDLFRDEDSAPAASYKEILLYVARILGRTEGPLDRCLLLPCVIAGVFCFLGTRRTMKEAFYYGKT